MNEADANDSRTRGRIPLIPRLFFGALAFLVLSWFVFMLHYVFVGSKQTPRPTPMGSKTTAPGQASP